MDEGEGQCGQTQNCEDVIMKADILGGDHTNKVPW